MDRERSTHGTNKEDRKNAEFSCKILITLERNCVFTEVNMQNYAEFLSYSKLCIN